MKDTQPVLLAISGVKNSGKTTLIEKLLPRLLAAGLEVAVIKHEGHSYTPDVPGTDTHRYYAAGAMGSAIFDGEKMSVTKRCAADESTLAQLFPEADLVLLEGFKASAYPKIELVRHGISGGPVCNPKTHIAIVSDFYRTPHTPVFRPDDLEGITDAILRYYHHQAGVAPQTQ